MWAAGQEGRAYSHRVGYLHAWVGGVGLDAAAGIESVFLCTQMEEGTAQREGGTGAEQLHVLAVGYPDQVERSTGLAFRMTCEPR
jgi:hypothetical protein